MMPWYRSGFALELQMRVKFLSNLGRVPPSSATRALTPETAQMRRISRPGSALRGYGVEPPCEQKRANSYVVPYVTDCIPRRSTK